MEHIMQIRIKYSYTHEISDPLTAVSCYLPVKNFLILAMKELSSV